jgi:hypothetical protein
MCFSTIQLLEAGIWISIREGSTYMNDLMTRLVLIVLLMQPLAQTYLGAHYTHSTFLYLLSFGFLGLLIWGLYRIGSSKSGQFSSVKGNNGHLVWDDKGTPLLRWETIPYLIGLFIPLLFIGWPGILLLLIGTATLVASLYYAPSREISSVWCFAAVTYAIAALFV